MVALRFRSTRVWKKNDYKRPTESPRGGGKRNCFPPDKGKESKGAFYQGGARKGKGVAYPFGARVKKSRHWEGALQPFVEPLEYGRKERKSKKAFTPKISPVNKKTSR